MTASDQNTHTALLSKELHPGLEDPACICQVPTSAPVCSSARRTPRPARLSAIAQPVPLSALIAQQSPPCALAPPPPRTGSARPPCSGAGPALSAFPSPAPRIRTGRNAPQRPRGRAQAGRRRLTPVPPGTAPAPPPTLHGRLPLPCPCPARGTCAPLAAIDRKSVV